MNYYKRHIGDYAKKAGHLSPLEHGVYTLILDNYYDREQGPTEAEAMRWARARNPDETQAVATVLREFFREWEGRYIQQRVEDELESAKAIAERNRTNGKLGGRKPRPRKTQTVKAGLPELRQSTNPLIHNLEEEAPTPGAKKSKAKEQTLVSWLTALDGEQAISADDPIYQWAADTGIPAGWLSIAWWVFEARYAEGIKKYADWRAVFRKACREDWLKVWRLDTRDAKFVLTTAGESARREMEAAS